MTTTRKGFQKGGESMVSQQMRPMQKEVVPILEKGSMANLKRSFDCCSVPFLLSYSRDSMMFTKDFYQAFSDDLRDFNEVF